MPSTVTPASPDFPLADLIQRDQGATLTCPLYSGASLVAPTQAGSTFSLLRPDRTAIVDAQAVTVSSSIARYTVSAGTIASESYGDGYLARWSLVVSGVTYLFENEAQIVRKLPAPAAAHHNIIGRYTDAERWLVGLEVDGAPATTFQHWLNEAWTDLSRWLIQRGNRPHLVSNSSDLVEAHILWTWYRFSEDLAQGADPDGRWAAAAEKTEKRLYDYLGTLTLRYDSSDAGTPDATRRAARGVLVLTSRGHGVAVDNFGADQLGRLGGR